MKKRERLMDEERKKGKKRKIRGERGVKSSKVTATNERKHQVSGGGESQTELHTSQSSGGPRSKPSSV